MKKSRDRSILSGCLILIAALCCIISFGGCENTTKKKTVEPPNACTGNTGDPDDNPCWFRDVRSDSWGLLIGNQSGIESVRSKLETLHGSKAPEVKVDLATDAFSDGNWHYEFAQLAEQSLAADDYFAATGYYTAASFPQMYRDSRAHEMYDLALDAFEDGLQDGQYDYKIITVEVDGVDINAYLVYPGSFNDGDVVPVILETGGIDGLMTIGFSDFTLHWNNAGVAWVGFDIPGLGTSKDLTLTYEAEKVHVAVIEALQEDASIDNDNIFVYSRSMGGYAALRLLVTRADELNIAGIAAVCPLAEYTFSAGMDMIESMPAMTRNAYGTRLGIDPDNYEALAVASEDFQFSNQGYWGDTFSSVPLLIYNTGGDAFNPVSEMEQMAALSSDGKFIVEEGEGHCGTRELALQEVAKLVDDNMR